MSFLSKAFKKVTHVANGVAHAVDSVAHSHVFQVVAGAAAIIFPPVGVPLAGAVAAENLAAGAAHEIHGATHAVSHAVAHAPEVRAQLNHVIDASDHVLNALNSKVAAHVHEAQAMIDHTKKLAASGHVGAQNGLLVLFRRAAGRKAAQNFHVDPHTARVVDRRSGQPAATSPHVNIGLHH